MVRSQAAVRKMIAKTGGARPVVPTEWSEARLSLAEREEDSLGIAGGISARQDRRWSRSGSVDDLERDRRSQLNLHTEVDVVVVVTPLAGTWPM